MTTAKVIRRLAAILVADICDYSRLMSVDEVATVRELKSRLATTTPIVGEFGGRIIDTAGDGLLVEFPSAVAAVECASKIQEVMALANAPLDEDRRMRFRIGINLGEVIHDGERIYGDGVNIAARIEKLAQAGGICVSSKVHDEIDKRVLVSSSDLGLHSLKNIARPVRVYALDPTTRQDDANLPSVDEIAEAAEPQRIRRLSIVVLPFVNASGDAMHDPLVDGITDDVTTQLSSIKESYVIGRNTAFRYRNLPVDVRTLGAELGVRYVLQGSVERVEAGVDTSVSLVDAETGRTLWTSTIEVNHEGVRSIPPRGGLAHDDGAEAAPDQRRGEAIAGRKTDSARRDRSRHAGAQHLLPQQHARGRAAGAGPVQERSRPEGRRPASAGGSRLDPGDPGLRLAGSR